VTINWHGGNATDDGQGSRGWLLGHFVDPTKGVQSTKDVEVKWGIHPTGDKRSHWVTDAPAVDFGPAGAGPFPCCPHRR